MITIAAATHLADVQRVLTVLVNNDAEGRAIAQERDVLALIAPQPSDAGSGSKVQSRTEVAVGEAKLHPPDNPQTTLLTALAAAY